uniref:16S rRNA (uracil(1498)-N(3))-methyltransferase n=1 Tax=Candidatus Enterococcus willemsii TaxID=1857215 RepID=UPI00403F409C
MQRYFLEEDYTAKEQYEVMGEPYHHMVRVMRMTPGNQVYLVFANQVSIVAEISGITESAVCLVEKEKEQQEKELPVAITIASGYPKGDKLDLIVQKGTELGAAGFIGFPAKTSVVKWDGKKLAKKQQRLEKIAQEAAEQSHRQVTPTVALLDSEKTFIQQLTQFDMIVIAYEESAKQGEVSQLAQILQTVKAGSRILAIFGPEGGLTPAEVEQFMAAGGQPCGLGPRILRTETAPFYLLSAASYQLELLKVSN